MPPTTRRALHDIVQATLQAAVQEHSPDHSEEDILRCFQAQATLLRQTARVKDVLLQDPFERWNGEPTALQSRIRRWVDRLQVTSYHRIVTKSGYCHEEAVVHFPMVASSPTTSQPKKIRTQNGGVLSHIQLVFHYERQARGDASSPVTEGESTAPASTVHYSIDYARDWGERHRLLWVQVWAKNHSPASHLPCRNIQQDDDDNDDEWEDVEGEVSEAEVVGEESKKQPKKNAASGADPTSMMVDEDENEDPVLQVEEVKNDNDDEADRFTAGMDPDALLDFLECAELSPMDDSTAFFFLMTFPFFEHEWDLVGLVLDAVFGFEDDEEDGADSGDEKDDDDEPRKRQGKR